MDDLKKESEAATGCEASAVERLVMCNCLNLCFADNDDLIRAGEKRHHKCCPLFKTEQHPRLFYYEDAVDCWTPYPNDIECVVGDMYLLDKGEGETEEVEIRFKWIWFTDEQMANLPED